MDADLELVNSRRDISSFVWSDFVDAQFEVAVKLGASQHWKHEETEVIKELVIGDADYLTSLRAGLEMWFRPLVCAIRHTPFGGESPFFDGIVSLHALLEGSFALQRSVTAECTMPFFWTGDVASFLAHWRLTMPKLMIIHNEYKPKLKNFKRVVLDIDSLGPIEKKILSWIDSRTNTTKAPTFDALLKLQKARWETFAEQLQVLQGHWDRIAKGVIYRSTADAWVMASLANSAQDLLHFTHDFRSALHRAFFCHIALHCSGLILRVAPPPRAPPDPNKKYVTGMGTTWKKRGRGADQCHIS